MLLGTLASLAWIGGGAAPTSFPLRSSARVAMVQSTPAAPDIGSDAAAAEMQARSYFDMAPWEQNPKLIPNQRLDLRAFIKPFDREGVSLATVVATQPGKLKARQGQSPIAKLDKAPGGPWRTVGCVAAPDEASLSSAVANQRALIEAWACELIRDFQTDARLLTRGDATAPIALAWVYRKGPFQFDWPNGYINEVPPGTPCDSSVRCGFLGSQCRSVRGKKGGFSFQAIELPS
jgi:hypothetical protein